FFSLSLIVKLPDSVFRSVVQSRRLHSSSYIAETFQSEHIRTEARRKNLLILILHYLTEEGYVDAANALEQETKFGLCRFEVCDNIDLETILMEYESYYYVKFQKYPKITKKVVDSRKWEACFLRRSNHVLQDIYLQNPNVKWNCIIGLDAAKRLVKEAVVLFELARYHAPSTIFLDELESVMSQRGTVL
ncbi:hypothetical protein L345_15208, partial [Ophiophagus hannah]